MKAKDIIVSSDFLNLTKDDVDKITNETDVEISDKVDDKAYLYSIREVLFGSEEARAIIENKIFAGKTSVKWYKINVDGDNLNEIVQRLESEDNYYNTTSNINTNNLGGPKVYSCIKLEENIYMMRVFIPIGSKTINDGIRLEKINSINNVVLFINLKNRYIEVRTNSRDSKRIINSICKPLIGHDIVEVEILNRYNGNIEDFNDSLNGKFIDVTSTPDLNIVLTRQQNELLVNVLKALDEYFINRDIERLKSEILDVDLGTEEIPFTQLFLAGLSEIGMATRMDCSEDLSNQSLYGILKSYMTNQSGFINFTLQDKEGIVHDYTIQVGIKTTNSISFRSSSTEQVIEYIRRKVLGY